MRLPGLLVAAFALTATFTACKSEDYPTKMCLSDEGTHQDCGIACTISKSDEACKKWEKMTVELCDQVGKDKCQEICTEDENKYACDKAKSM